MIVAGRPQPIHDHSLVRRRELGGRFRISHFTQHLNHLCQLYLYLGATTDRTVLCYMCLCRLFYAFYTCTWSLMPVCVMHANQITRNSGVAYFFLACPDVYVSSGYIGSGRQNWDGSGGTGAALRHYEDTGRM